VFIVVSVFAEAIASFVPQYRGRRGEATTGAITPTLWSASGGSRDTRSARSNGPSDLKHVTPCCARPSPEPWDRLPNSLFRAI